MLVDAPTVLGRERWGESAVYRAADALLSHRESADREVALLERRMLLAALAEAALTIAESSDPNRLASASEERVANLLASLRE